MNDRDSEALLGLFLDRGYSEAEDELQAEVVLVNTCSVRDHAENRAISYAGTFKKNSPKTIVGIIGCMARNRGQELFKRMHQVKLICGPSSLGKIPSYIDKIKTENTRILDLDDSLRDEEMYASAFRMEPDHAQVVISTGCSNYCSYCIVPYVRGKLRLRNPEDIVNEVKRNIDLGIKKITLLGQNVNDYTFKSPDTSFVDLLKMVDSLPGIDELSFVTSHPKNTSKDLFEVMAQSEKIKKHLHLPFQSGSNRILELMHRDYTREKYLQLVADYKKIVKGHLSTDVIIGYPSETEEDFKGTRDIIEKVEFKYAYIFKYSPRMRTSSAQIKDDISENDKARRHKIVLDLQKKISKAKQN